MFRAESSYKYSCKAYSYNHCALYEDEQLILTDSLDNMLFFCKTNKYKVEILFKLQYIQIISKKIPQNLSKKDQNNWIKYQEKDLFDDDDFLIKCKNQSIVSWIGFGPIKALFQKYSSVILNQQSEILQIVNNLKSISKSNKYNLILLKEEDKLICLGFLEDQIITARILDWDKYSLHEELEDTFSYIKTFSQNIENNEDKVSLTLLNLDHDEINFIEQLNLSSNINLQTSEISIQKEFKPAYINLNKDSSSGNYLQIISALGIISLFLTYSVYRNITFNNALKNTIIKNQKYITEKSENISNKNIPALSIIQKLEEVKTTNEINRNMFLNIEKLMISCSKIVNRISFNSKIEVIIKINSPNNYDLLLNLKEIIEKFLIKVLNHNNFKLSLIDKAHKQSYLEYMLII